MSEKTWDPCPATRTLSRFASRLACADLPESVRDHLGRLALDGAFLLARAAVPQMMNRGGGAIVAVSGISPHVGTSNRCHVSASKAGLEGFVRVLAVELAPRHITCNCVAPGAIDTVRGESAGGKPSNISGNRIPLGRKGTVKEIAAMVLSLIHI